MPSGRRKKKTNSVLDRTPPCPNVDVRLLNPGGAPGIPPPPGGQPQGNPAMMHPSFLENPTFFLAQQAAFVNNSLNTTSKQQQQQQAGDGEGPTPAGPGGSAQSSPVARLAPGRSPPLVGKSPPAMGKSPISSPGLTPLNLPSPASQVTPCQMTPPRSRRSSISSHSNATSPCVTPHSNMKSPPAAGVVHESPCSANESFDSSASSGRNSINQSPGGVSFCAATQSPPSVQKVAGRLNASPISPRGPHPPLPFDMPNDLQIKKLPKSPKGGRTKAGAAATAQAKNKLNNNQSQINQMDLSFSNALEFQQLLASKYAGGGTGNFPASNLLTAAAKAQGNNSNNPLTQALSQLQQGLCSQGKAPKGRTKKGKSSAAKMNKEQQLSAGHVGAGKKDDFHAGSFLVNEVGS